MARTYYKVKPEREIYLGKRMFRMDSDYRESVTQICITNGDSRKGKSNTFGIYLIQRTTFYCNYFAMVYLSEITEADWLNQFNETIKFLT